MINIYMGRDKEINLDYTSDEDYLITLYIEKIRLESILNEKYYHSEDGFSYGGTPILTMSANENGGGTLLYSSLEKVFEIPPIEILIGGEEKVSKWLVSSFTKYDCCKPWIYKKLKYKLNEDDIWIIETASSRRTITIVLRGFNIHNLSIDFGKEGSIYAAHDVLKFLADTIKIIEE